MSERKGAAKIAAAGLVLDSSVALAWCFPDEQDAYSQAVLNALAVQTAYVPELWYLEVANTLVVGERRVRSAQAETVAWMGFLSELPIVVDELTRFQAFSEITHLARSHNLSSYDAAYQELAMRRGLPLATLDERLKSAARAVGASLHDAS